MIVKEDVDMISSYTASAVLGRVHHAVDHEFGAEGNHLGVHGHRVAGRGDGSGAGMAAPALGTGAAGTVTGCLKNAQRNQILVSRGFLGLSLGLGIALGVVHGVGKIRIAHITFHPVLAVRKGGPVHGNGESVAAVAFSLALQLFTVFPRGYPLAEHFFAGGVLDGNADIDGGIGHVLLVSPAGNLSVRYLLQPSGGNRGQMP